MTFSIISVEIRHEQTVVLARQRARQIAAALLFDPLDQVRIATAVSELARNVFQYAGTGRVEFQVVQGLPAYFQIRVSDRGPGIKQLQSILDGLYVSPTGMGLGLMGVRRLMDHFEISTSGEGTTIVIGKNIAPSFSISTQTITQISEKLARESSQDLYQEIQQQNQELLAAMDLLEKKRNELSQVNRELEETNRGVVALYAELNEKAESVRKASDVKNRFLSNITHELRTPLNSILSLTRFLLTRSDGDLSEEQDKQVSYIKHSAENLIELVNDLLDLAKVESGKAVVQPAALEIADLFGALRGMLRPLVAANSKVNLVFDTPQGLPPLFTDETKLSQILRNFISNALKFTDQGEIRVLAVSETPGWITLSVADTGVGIAPQHQELIFEEFVQVENALQKKFKGTGLGLSLSKKLAELLGGRITVKSRVGIGSTFSVTIPQVYEQPKPALPEKTSMTVRNEGQFPAILIIDDDAASRHGLKELLPGEKFTYVEAEGGIAGLERAKSFPPAVIVLDLIMPDMDGFEVLEELEADERTRWIPVIIHTSRKLTEPERVIIGKKTSAILSKPPTAAEFRNALRAAGLHLAEES